MIRGLHHVGIVVADLDAAVEHYRLVFGLSPRRPPSPRGSRLSFALIPLPGAELELLAEAASDTPISKFLASRGPGLHHIAFEVDDIGAAIDALSPHGLEPLEPPARGIHGTPTCFFHPKATHGVLVEFVEGPGPEGRR
jgi:methylmalonyl-CoA/ethylmalonyl-CoA epimerase